jgi:hypothetical protein
MKLTNMRYTGKKGIAWNWIKKIMRKKYRHCYTCPARDIISYNSQSGHYQPVGLVGSNNYLAWDTDFIRLQCGHCNGVGQGMQNIFRENLVEEHGEEKVAEFDRQVKAKTVNPVKDWDSLISKLKEEYENI